MVKSHWGPTHRCGGFAGYAVVATAGVPMGTSALTKLNPLFHIARSRLFGVKRLSALSSLSACGPSAFLVGNGTPDMCPHGTTRIVASCGVGVAFPWLVCLESEGTVRPASPYVLKIENDKEGFHLTASLWRGFRVMK